MLGDFMSLTEFLAKTKENIVKQPEFVTATLLMADRDIQSKVIPLLERRTFEKIFLVGCGDSYFAGQGIQFVFNKYVKLPTFAENAFEFKEYENIVDNESLVIGISAGGRTSATIYALKKAKEKGAKTVSITNFQESPITKVSDAIIITRVPEPVGPPTSTTTTALVAGYLLAINMGYSYGIIDDDKFTYLRNALISLPTKMKWIMSDKNKETNMTASKAFSKSNDAYIIGGGPAFITAELINALMKEIVLIHSEAIEIEEFCHYGLIPVEKDTPIILFARSGNSYNRAKEISQVLKNIGARIYVVTDKYEEFRELADYIIIAPEGIPEEFSPVVDIIPTQFLSLHWSIDRGLKLKGFRYGDMISKLIGYLE